MNTHPAVLDPNHPSNKEYWGNTDLMWQRAQQLLEITFHQNAHMYPQSNIRGYSLQSNISRYFARYPRLSIMAKDLLRKIAQSTYNKEENKEVENLLISICGMKSANIAEFKQLVMVGVIAGEKKIRRMIDIRVNEELERLLGL